MNRVPPTEPAALKTRMTAPPPARMDRFDWLALAALVVTAGAMIMAYSRRPTDLAAWQDDAVYLATAKSLADGHGYRHNWLPGEPWQTKYPPAYPFVVALLWKAADLARRPLVLQGANVLMLLGAHWLAYRTIRRGWGQPWIIAAFGAVLSMANFFWFQLCASAMSEAMFALASCAAVAWGTRAITRPGGAGREPGAGPARRSWLWPAIGAGAACGLALLTRSIGVAVLGGVVVALAWRKSWRSGAVVAGLGALAAAGWIGWRSHAAGLNAAIPQAAALGYELDYSLWVAHAPATLARVFGLNISDALYELGFLARPLPGSWISWALAGGSGTSTLLFAWLAFIAWLTASGFARSIRAGGGVAHCVVVLQLAMVLAWPFTPLRFLAPMLMWLIPWMLIGASAVMRGPALKKQAPSKLGPTRWQWFGLAPMMLLLALPSPPQQLGTMLFPREDDAPAARAELASLIERATPPEAVVAASGGGVLHLMTGRRFLLPVRTVDPVALYYHDERSYLDLGLDLQMTQSKARAVSKEVEALPGYYAGAGARYLAFPNASNEYTEPFARLRIQNADMFREVDRAGGCTLYAVAARP